MLYKWLQSELMLTLVSSSTLTGTIKVKTEDVLSTSVLTTWGGEAPISSEAPCLHECRRVMDSIGFRSSMHNSDVRVGCVACV